MNLYHRRKCWVPRCEHTNKGWMGFNIYWRINPKWGMKEWGSRCVMCMMKLNLDEENPLLSLLPKSDSYKGRTLKYNTRTKL